ncbi:MAG: hypothetical protein WCJ14_09305, partial [Verrucomicrobiota bacterium]
AGAALAVAAAFAGLAAAFAGLAAAFTGLAAAFTGLAAALAGFEGLLAAAGLRADFTVPFGGEADFDVVFFAAMAQRFKCG